MAIGATRRTGTVYLAPYHVLDQRDFKPSARRTPVGAAFRAAVERREWLYDPSEDPSFFCASYLKDRGGCLTWGICRPDLCEQLRLGDTVAFFAVSSPRAAPEYRFVGYATVAEKVSQDQIWTEDRLAVYREYLNLLVEPLDESGTYVHRENHPGGGHPDWLWRLVRRQGYPWKKGDFARWEESGFSKTVRLGVDTAARRQPVRFDRKYVIFEPGPPETVILSEPPLVARSRGGREPERWLEDPFAKALRRLTLAETDRTLRTTATQNQHRQVRLPTKAIDWREEVLALIEAQGLAEFR